MDRYHFDGKAFARSRRLGLTGGSSNDAGEYQCHECGAAWKAGPTWAWWPVSLRWADHWSFGRHGVEVGWDGIERPVVAQVWSIGPLRIVLGLPAAEPRDEGES